MSSRQQLLAEAQAVHEGDRQALLAAINEAAANIGPKKGGNGPSSTTGSTLMKKAGTNANIARDLVSNAGASRVGDMNDFAGASASARAQQFEQGKTLLNNRAEVDAKSRQMEEDLRSLRSEYDYGSKKKFVDVLGNVSAQTKLNRMRAQHEIEQATGGHGAFSIKGSERSVVSYKSAQSNIQSVRSKYSQIAQNRQNRQSGMAEAVANAIPESIADEDELEAKPEDFIACLNCGNNLSEDEKIINARFVNEAMAASRDISLFPICIGCNFENLEQQQRDVKNRDRKYAMMKESKGVFFPSNKKLYDVSMHQNSEEFKQLGTMHMENRASDYYPLEKPQPKAVAASPLTAIKMERVVAGASQMAGRNSATRHGRTQSLDIAKAVDDPDKSRSAHIKNLVADRMKEEEIRSKLVAEEIVKMRRSGPRASSATRRKTEVLFPTTTNQETHNEDIHGKRPIDKTNFKKKNPFSAYVNSMFNAGVFVNPWQDGC